MKFMSDLKLKNIFDAAKDYDIILLDIWGVIIEGNATYPGIVDAINELTKSSEVYFVSNSPRPAGILYKMIESWGIDTSVGKVFCSGEVTRSFLKTLGNPVIYHLGKDRNHDILLNTNYSLTDNINKANVLLMTLYRDEGENIAAFDGLLKEAANLQITNLCANPDVIVPNAGTKRYAPGHFAKKIEEAGGKVMYMGKPYTQIYDAVFAQIPAVPKNKILMIGDSFETDILGAKNAGIHSALVLTGNAAGYHKQYENIEDKLKILSEKAREMNLAPNFVVELKQASS
jgi:HAD superfamily hydrolase (TIGR01459 family)